MDDRAVSPVVGKALEASLVVLYIGLLSATLYGNVVPDYRTTAGAEVGDRVLSKATQRVQQAIPPDAVAVEARVRVEIPDRIRGRTYEIRAEDRSLVLDHPNPDIGATARLALPETVEDVSGAWTSDGATTIVVRSTENGLAVTLAGDDG